MRIDRIIPHGKTRSRVLFDEGLVIMLYNTEIHRMKLAEGSELSDDYYEKNMLPMLTKRAKERLVYILKSSDKPESELRKKLKEDCYPQQCIEEAIAWAAAKHYVDDARYIETYLRYHSDGKSEKKLLYDLQAKGLDRKLILDILEESEVDEDEQIRTELARKHYSPDMDPKEKRKIAASMIRKGYSWDSISAYIR